MPRIRVTLALLVAALVGGAPARAEAQITGAVAAAIDILYPPLTGAGVRPLDFGVLIPGVAVAPVNPGTAKAAEYRITGVKSRKSIDITFTLPTALTGPGGATIPLNFNGNYAALCELNDAGVCQTASYFTWNPVTTPSFHDTPARYQPGRKTYTYDTYAVSLGGAATPTASQRAGHYTATIGVTIVIN